jgi:cytochrome c oxidase subunit 2
MKSMVKVLSKEKYTAWYGDTANLANASVSALPGAPGLAIMKIQGCLACHSSDGSKIVGPTYLNLFGSQQTVIREGTAVTVTVDEAYVRQMILDPASQVVKGYPKGLMQSYKGKVSDADITKIIEYLKTLNEK